MADEQGLFENDMSIKKKLAVSISLAFILNSISFIVIGNLILNLIIAGVILGGAIWYALRVVAPLEGYGTRELASILDDINTNIASTVDGVMQDAMVIAEAKRVCHSAALGIYDVGIKATASSAELNSLKEFVNNLISSTGHNINRIVETLNSYENDNYTHRIKSHGKTTGKMKEVFDKVDLLGDSLASNAQDNLGNGRKILNDTETLEKIVEEIKDFFVHQSDELDQSVGQLAQITSEIKQTTMDAQDMDSYAKNVTKSVSHGQELAGQTAHEMDAIVTQVSSINEAITIIDQIAFQTNILSLNAAVEAATAGEAGKGFAVVAQEVRNLANRSAEAAKEIKDLVEKATDKANYGKQISDKMMEGYDELNEHIGATISLIHNVTHASQNQQISIEKINLNISNIKEQTLNSTQIAQKASSVASDTSNLASTIVNEALTKKV